jgi:hypothetical protein
VQFGGEITGETGATRRHRRTGIFEPDYTVGLLADRRSGRVDVVASRVRKPMPKGRTPIARAVFRGWGSPRRNFRTAKAHCGEVLDMKVGNGAFMKKQVDARRRAQMMVGIGRRMDKRVQALLTDMNQPLGYAVGNALEVMEASQTLHNAGPADLTRLSIELAARMIFVAKAGAFTRRCPAARGEKTGGRPPIKLEARPMSCALMTLT